MNHKNIPDSLPDETSLRQSRTGRVLRFAVPAVLIVSTVICFLVLSIRAVSMPDYSWTDYTYICHAMGAVDDAIHYTNTAEAFRINYEKGYRVFEVDLEYTSDGKIVCLHSWKRSFFKKHLGIKRSKKLDGVPMTYDEFMGLTFHDKYPASDFRMICEVLKEHPDAWLVLDGKASDPDEVRAQYTELADTLKEICPEALPHVIPQIYNEEMLDIIYDIYDWNSVIFTLYQLEEQAAQQEEASGQEETTEREEAAAEPQPEPEKAAQQDAQEEFDPLKEVEFAGRHEIGVVTVSYELLKAHPEIVTEAHNRDIKVFVHTVDSSKKWARLKKANVDGIYTNWRQD